MSEVATIEPREQGGALTPMEMLDRAVTNGASPEALEKLMNLQERWNNRAEKSAYDAAMADMQEDLPIIEKTKQGHNYKYADWGAIKEQIQPTLSKHGFAITHRIKVAENHVVVTAICSHREGHREETEFPLPFDKTGSKNDVQARGSSVEYGKRYTGCAILGIATKDETDPDAKGEGYDTSEWTDKIIDAGNRRDELLKVQQELKARRKEIPDGAWKILSNAWSQAMKGAK